MGKPVIKTAKDRNRYILTPSHYWVRDFAQTAFPIDINDFVRSNERHRLVDNEIGTLSMLVPEIGSDYLPKLPKVVIVSDGFNFNEKRHVLESLPKDVCIIGTNRALANWNVDKDGFVKRKMDYYFVNNPYPECMSYMPTHKYRPRCICSIRTNTAFLKKYRGSLFHYVPTPSKEFGNKRMGTKPLDDYRNPICGALSLAIKCGMRKLLFFCCDDVFAESRPAAEQLPNGLWMYPQHKIPFEIIDGMLYWLKRKAEDDGLEVEVRDHSSGLYYKHANYIEIDAIQEFLI